MRITTVLATLASLGGIAAAQPTEPGSGTTDVSPTPPPQPEPPPPGPTPPPPQPPPPSHEIVMEPAHASDGIHPTDIAFAIGIGYARPAGGSFDLQKPNVASVRLRLMNGITLEPIVAIANTSADYDDGDDGYDRHDDRARPRLARAVSGDPARPLRLRGPRLARASMSSRRTRTATTTRSRRRRSRSAGASASVTGSARTCSSARRRRTPCSRTAAIKTETEPGRRGLDEAEHDDVRGPVRSRDPDDAPPLQLRYHRRRPWILPSSVPRSSRTTRRVKRDLPWRRTRDPYAIWVSEIMLQQTRVADRDPVLGALDGAVPDGARARRCAARRRARGVGRPRLLLARAQPQAGRARR